MKAMKCDNGDVRNIMTQTFLLGETLWFEHIILTDCLKKRDNIDLCPDCRKSFNLWLKEGAE